jgi:hypothetical protein
MNGFLVPRGLETFALLSALRRVGDVTLEGCQAWITPQKDAETLPDGYLQGEKAVGISTGDIPEPAGCQSHLAIRM